MKRFMAILMVLCLIFGMIPTTYSEDLATPTDLIEERDYSISLSNLYKYSLVALNDLTLGSHTRGSIWVGGTLYGSGNCVDDGSLNHEIGPSDSYIAINDSSVQFKGRTGEQSTTAYYGLTSNAISNTRSYWRNLITNVSTDENWIYLAPDENGHVDATYWDYQCPGSDESQSSIEKIYWTDATSVSMGGLAGHLIAPNATVNITWCNHCGSIVANNIVSNGEAHINYWTPPAPPTPSPTPSPTPIPTPKPITVTKLLKGEIWQVRCDVMDNTTFTAGGGKWKADITNFSNSTSKE